jgi:hypothetical protein
VTAVLRRIIVVPFAYVAAMAAAGLTVTLGIGPAPDHFLSAFVANTILLVTATFIFAVLAIIASEVAAVRSLYHYLATGLALGLAASLILFMVGLNPTYGTGILLDAAAGLVGGLTYWLIAGVRAGAAMLEFDY